MYEMNTGISICIKIANKEKQRELLTDVKNDAEWLIRMVENLLSVTRIDSGNVKLIKTPTVLDELIDSVVTKFSKRYPHQAITIDIPEDVVIIPMDPMLIQQVLINMLENSVHHAHGMTTLTLKVTVKNSCATFTVADDGCGIDPTRLPHIFNGAGMSDKNASDNQKRNAGIGLSVCSSIINAHGGEIHAENNQLGGAIFSFTLNTEEIIDE